MTAYPAHPALRMRRACTILANEYDLPFNAGEDCGSIFDGTERYMLVESNRRGSSPPNWVTYHDSPDAAADYNVNQEYAEDWEVDAIFDLDRPPSRARLHGYIVTAARWVDYG